MERLNGTCWSINQTWYRHHVEEALPDESDIIRFTAWLTFYIIFLIQIVGNGITIYLLLCTNIRGKTNIFVGSLAVCDLVSGINSPVGAYREVPGRTDFQWPGFVNDVYVFVEFYTSFVANFHIAVFATFRLVTQSMLFEFTRIHLLTDLKDIYQYADVFR